MQHRTLGLTVGRVKINRRRRLGSGPWPLLADINPQAPCFGTPAARIEHRDRRVVGEQMVGGKHFAAEFFVQGSEPPARAADPTGESRPFNLDTMAGEDLRLPVQRQVVAIFGDQYLCEQRRRRQSTCDRTLRRGCLVDRAAGTTTIFRAADAHDTELSRHPVEHLANTFTDGMQHATTAWTGSCIDIDKHLLARQMFGQHFAPRAFIRIAGCDFGRRLERLSLGKIGLNIFESKRKLIVIKAFGPASKLRALKLLDDQLETL